MWACVQGVLRGKFHIQNDIPCQDKVAFRRNNNSICISLADGAGSCSLSEIGAEIAVDTTCQYFSKDFERTFELDYSQIARELIHRIRTRLGIRAKKDGHLLNDYSSTLLFCAISEDKVIIGHLGDGVIGGICDKDMHILSFPDNGEFANTTYFTTSANYQQHFRIKRIVNTSLYKAFVLMSDGSSECLYDKKNKQLANAIKIISSWIDTNPEKDVNRALVDNMQDLFYNKTTDDCSIIMAQHL